MSNHDLSKTLESYNTASNLHETAAPTNETRCKVGRIMEVPAFCINYLAALSTDKAKLPILPIEDLLAIVSNETESETTAINCKLFKSKIYIGTSQSQIQLFWDLSHFQDAVSTLLQKQTKPEHWWHKPHGNCIQSTSCTSNKKRRLQSAKSNCTNSFTPV